MTVTPLKSDTHKNLIRFNFYWGYKCCPLINHNECVSDYVAKCYPCLSGVDGCLHWTEFFVCFCVSGIAMIFSAGTAGYRQPRSESETWGWGWSWSWTGSLSMMGNTVSCQFWYFYHIISTFRLCVLCILFSVTRKTVDNSSSVGGSCFTAKSCCWCCATSWRQWRTAGHKWRTAVAGQTWRTAGMTQRMDRRTASWSSYSC